MIILRCCYVNCYFMSGFIIFNETLCVLGGGATHCFDGRNYNNLTKFEGPVMEIKYATFHQRNDIFLEKSV